MITLVMPTCGRPLTLANTLAGIGANLPRVEDVVVKLRIIHNDADCWPSESTICLGRNRGNVVARNVGVATVRGGLVCFLDDDSWPGAGVIELAVEAFARDPKLGVIACRVVAPDWRPTLDDVDRTGREVESWTGCGGIVRRELIPEFSEDGLLASAWEWELVAEVRRRGYTIKAFNDIYVHHSFSQEGPPGDARMSRRKKLEAVSVPMLFWARYGPAKQLLWHGLRWCHAIAQATLEQRTGLYLHGYARTLARLPEAWQTRKPVTAEVAARLRPTMRFKGK